MFIRFKYGHEGIVKDIGLNKRLLFVSISFIYAVILTSLPLMEFQDRSNYLNYANSSDLIFLSYLTSGIGDVIFNEPVWLIFNIILGFFLSAETVLRIFVFLPSIIVSYYALTKSKENLFWLILILLLPVILKNHITHLRQGVAISIFLLALMSHKNYLRGGLLTLTPFIHSSFFIIIFLYIVAEILKKIPFKRDLNTSLIGITSVILSLSLGFLIQFTGARQAERYTFSGSEGTGLNFILWFVILVVYLCQGKQHFKNYLFEYSVIILYLASYFFVDVTARIFESAVLLVLLSGFELTKWRKIAFYFFLILIFIFQWMGRLLREGTMF